MATSSGECKTHMVNNLAQDRRKAKVSIDTNECCPRNKKKQQMFKPKKVSQDYCKENKQHRETSSRKCARSEEN